MKVTTALRRAYAFENLEGRLRLRWTCPETGKRKTLALGMDDSTTGRAFAATIKDRIETDARHGYYDASLLKYRPLTIGKNATEITTVELLDRFTQYQFKNEGLAKSSIESRYKPVKRMLEKHLNIRRLWISDGRLVSRMFLLIPLPLVLRKRESLEEKK